MKEQSIFNVACKLAGLYSIFLAISSLVWAFVVSRNRETGSFGLIESEAWIHGAIYGLIGLLLCCRSSAVTRLLYWLDGPFEE